MKHQTPVVRQISWILVIPQILALGVTILTTTILFWDQYGVTSVTLGAIIYLVYSYGSRTLLMKHHRNGRLHTDNQEFELAIEEFQKSYHFFTRNSWIDNHRYITMMSPSKQSVREMALINFAYAYGQMGNKEKTVEYYRRALQEFPESIMAKTALNFIDTVDSNN